MSVDEYIYVDHSRLESYYEQIGDPVKYHKLPTWKASLSLTGPAVEAQQSQVERIPTVSEKLKELIDYLAKNGQLKRHRPIERQESGSGNVFRLETCEATKVRIPALKPEALVPPRKELLEEARETMPHDPRRTSTASEIERRVSAARQFHLSQAQKKLSDFNGVELWVSPTMQDSDGHVRQHQLFLLMDDHRDDEGHISGGSAYSALLVLWSELRTDLERTVLRDADPEIGFASSHLERQFLKDPLQALISSGAIAITSRRITTLYRVRRSDISGSEDDGTETFSTIGYAIYIAAAD